MKAFGKVVEMNDGSKVFLRWKEIYNLCGCVQEDFLYDTSGECYKSLVEAIESKGENK